MLEWIRDLLQMNVELVQAGGYAGILLLMAVESSFIPFPSEVVVPPAGYLVARGVMDPWAVMAAAVAGSLLGAWFNYWFAIRVGRPFFHRYGKWFLVKEASIDRAEQFFRRHGEIGTFVGRLVPVVRQLISIPAGMARMDPARFTLYTALGSGTWCGVLLGVGWSIGRHSDHLDAAAVAELSRRWSLWLLPVLAVVVLAYVLARRRRARAVAAAGGPPGTPAGADAEPPGP